MPCRDFRRRRIFCRNQKNTAADFLFARIRSGKPRHTHFEVFALAHVRVIQAARVDDGKRIAFDKILAHFRRSVFADRKIRIAVFNPSADFLCRIDRIFSAEIGRGSVFIDDIDAVVDKKRFEIPLIPAR